MSDETPQTLNPIEKATLTGLVAARTAVMNEIEGYLTNVLSARLGVHRSRIANVDVQTGIVTMASDAPKPEEAKAPGAKE